MHHTLHHLSSILLIRNFFTDLLFLMYELTVDHKFTERRHISYTYKLKKLVEFKLKLVLIDKQIISYKLN